MLLKRVLKRSSSFVFGNTVRAGTGVMCILKNSVHLNFNDGQHTSEILIRTRVVIYVNHVEKAVLAGSIRNTGLHIKAAMDISADIDRHRLFKSLFFA